MHRIAKTLQHFLADKKLYHNASIPSGNILPILYVVLAPLKEHPLLYYL